MYYKRSKMMETCLYSVSPGELNLPISHVRFQRLNFENFFATLWKTQLCVLCGLSHPSVQAHYLFNDAFRRSLSPFVKRGKIPE